MRYKIDVRSRLPALLLSLLAVLAASTAHAYSEPQIPGTRVGAFTGVTPQNRIGGYQLASLLSAADLELQLGGSTKANRLSTTANASGSGLFLQRDPMGYADSVNLYAGFAWDPINKRDPTGRETCPGGGVDGRIRFWRVDGKCPGPPRMGPVSKGKAMRDGQTLRAAYRRAKARDCGSVITYEQKERCVSRWGTQSEREKWERTKGVMLMFADAATAGLTSRFTSNALHARKAAQVDVNPRQSSWLRGEEKAEAALVDKVKERGYNLEIVDEAHPRYREWQEDMTNAEIAGDTISLRPDARRIEVLEELLHGMQESIERAPRYSGGAPSWVDYPNYELHVKDFMIRHRKMLGISDADAEILRKMILRQMGSQVDTLGRPLVLPRSARTPIGE